MSWINADEKLPPDMIPVIAEIYYDDRTMITCYNATYSDVKGGWVWKDPWTGEEQVTFPDGKYIKRWWKDEDQT